MGDVQERMRFPYMQEMTERARTLRKKMTYAERLLWKSLRGRQIEGYKFLRQKPLLHYIVDFYCADLKLVIEVDGDIHREQFEYDALRDMELRHYGATIVRYANKDIVHRLPDVLRNLSERIRLLHNTPFPT